MRHDCIDYKVATVEGRSVPPLGFRFMRERLAASRPRPGPLAKLSPSCLGGKGPAGPRRSAITKTQPESAGSFRWQSEPSLSLTRLAAAAAAASVSRLMGVCLGAKAGRDVDGGWVVPRAGTSLRFLQRDVGKELEDTGDWITRRMTAIGSSEG
ncbi:hypothetical protein E2C01_049024 [Portunus trituberculatus]|uniref:Uncharacterized protein n=1 Tax=Portunus trituberculatus TaxID=210409 RepID=A0A5B7G551_PORTR|nr:hypothetical protein [Portunus trituberculatus]